jgi:lipopolysaccharide/colanic/teichoic acid biosynthesis glycosyltransferase
MVLTPGFFLGKLGIMSPFHLLKRGLDVLISLSALVVLSPLLAAIAIAIKLGSKGPIFFKQKRAGKNGKPFTLYKFRTMKMDAERFGSSPKTSTDPRLTKIGRILREYSLDELPQLVNVLLGDMSVVGPRPLYLSQMAEWSERQKKRLSVKPGMTGLAQISGRAEITREEKLELDVTYVETAGLFMDASIMLRTLSHVFKRKGIYEKRYSQTQYTRSVR